LNKAINKFEKMDFKADEIGKYAKKFDKKVFKEKILKFIVSCHSELIPEQNLL
jgi:hypothetical protein